jgi:hypothetical protein
MFADLTAADIRDIATVQEQSIAAYPWTRVDQMELSAKEQEHTTYIRNRFEDFEAYRDDLHGNPDRSQAMTHVSRLASSPLRLLASSPHSSRSGLRV